MASGRGVANGISSGLRVSATPGSSRPPMYNPVAAQRPYYSPSSNYTQQEPMYGVQNPEILIPNQYYRNQGPSTIRTTTQRSDGSDVMDTSIWDSKTGTYQHAGSNVGQSAAQRFNGAMGNFDSLLAKLNGIGGTLPPRIKPPDPANREKYNAALFGRTKDRIGAQARASSDDMADLMSARGIGGSGIEAGEVGKIVRTGQGQLGEARRDQAIGDLQRFEHNEDRDYGGNIQQRGQDISFESSKGQMINPLISLLKLQAGLY